MNLLTGKAYEDFRKWTNNSLLSGHGIGCGCGAVFNFEDYSEYIQLSIIKEWFDIVGIYIMDYALHDIGCGWDIDTKGEEYEGEERFKTRTEAIRSAIEKANQIYNETHA